jgi:hypothetical protein
MYFRQKHYLATIESILGLLIAICTLLSGTRIIFLLLNSENYADPGDGERYVRVIFVMLLATLISTIMVGMFPDIKVEDRGIRYRLFYIYTMLIKWEEMEDILFLRNGFIALGISRPGVSLFNGLYLNKLYSHIIKYDQPILFLSPGLEKKEEILQEIIEKSHPRIIELNKYPNGK